MKLRRYEQGSVRVPYHTSNVSLRRNPKDACAEVAQGASVRLRVRPVRRAQSTAFEEAESLRSAAVSSRTAASK